MLMHTSTVISRIDKARRFETALLGIPEADWKTVVAFYSALHWVGAAYEHQTGNVPPEKHVVANKVYGYPGQAIPNRVFVLYKDLQSYSETVRYELEPPLIPEEYETVQAKFEQVRDWAKSILGVQ